MLEASDNVKSLFAVTMASAELSKVTAFATVRLVAGVREKFPNSKVAMLSAPVPEKTEFAVRVILVDAL